MMTEYINFNVVVWLILSVFEIICITSSYGDATDCYVSSSLEVQFLYNKYFI